MKPSAALPFLPFILGLAIGAAITLDRLPGLIMGRAMDRIETMGAAAGAVRHAPRVTAENQTIVRSSPDILYSVCLFDLADGPVRIDATWPADGNYASISFYDANTNNFAVESDRDVDAASTSLMLTQGTEWLTVPDLRDGADRQVNAPTTTGLILFRRVIDATTDLDTAEAERRGFTCTQMADQ